MSRSGRAQNGQAQGGACTGGNWEGRKALQPPGGASSISFGNYEAPKKSTVFMQPVSQPDQYIDQYGSQSKRGPSSGRRASPDAQPTARYPNHGGGNILQSYHHQQQQQQQQHADQWGASAHSPPESPNARQLATAGSMGGSPYGSNSNARNAPGYGHSSAAPGDNCNSSYGMQQAPPQGSSYALNRFPSLAAYCAGPSAAAGYDQSLAGGYSSPPAYSRSSSGSAYSSSGAYAGALVPSSRQNSIGSATQYSSSSNSIGAHYNGQYGGQSRSSNAGDVPATPLLSARGALGSGTFGSGGYGSSNHNTAANTDPFEPILFSRTASRGSQGGQNGQQQNGQQWGGVPGTAGGSRPVFTAGTKGAFTGRVNMQPPGGRTTLNIFG